MESPSDHYDIFKELSHETRNPATRLKHPLTLPFPPESLKKDKSITPTQPLPHPEGGNFY
jgi:hypothetical protein